MTAKPIYIFDLDGTLSNADHRKHMLDDHEDSTRWRRFYAACGKDEPVGAVIAMFNLLRLTGNDVRIWTGRSDEVADITVEWLANNTSLMTHDVPHVIRMRESADHTPDDKLKQRWLDEMQWDDRQRIVAVFEDRSRVVAMWRAAGIPCFQVADGEF